MIIIITVTLNVYINTETIMSAIRRVMSLRIVTISLKQLKRRLLKRMKTRLKSNNNNNNSNNNKKNVTIVTR